MKYITTRNKRNTYAARYARAARAAYYSGIDASSTNYPFTDADNIPVRRNANGTWSRTRHDD